MNCENHGQHRLHAAGGSRIPWTSEHSADAGKGDETNGRKSALRYRRHVSGRDPAQLDVIQSRKDRGNAEDVWRIGRNRQKVSGEFYSDTA